MPGIISGVLSVLYCYLATEEIYGPSLYMVFPMAAPKEGSRKLAKIQGMFDKDHHDLVEPGEDRGMGTQALIQLSALAITLAVAVVGKFMLNVHNEMEINSCESNLISFQVES